MAEVLWRLHLRIAGLEMVLVKAIELRVFLATLFAVFIARVVIVLAACSNKSAPLQSHGTGLCFPGTAGRD
jgi:hypothetical protein